MEVTYNKCHAIGRPGDVDLVITISTPLRLEFYDCNARRGLRGNWEAPFGVARATSRALCSCLRRLRAACRCRELLLRPGHPSDREHIDHPVSYTHLTLPTILRV